MRGLLRASERRLLRWAAICAAVCVGCSGGDTAGSRNGSRPSDAGLGDGAQLALDAAVQRDAGARDAASLDDAGSFGADASAADGGPDAAVPYVFTPDPVTMGESLPAVIPVLRVNVGGQTVDKDVDVPGTLDVFEDHDGTLTDLAGKTPTLTSAIAFEGRGNFTWSLPKKGYAFELQDGAGNALEQSLLGMPPGSDFALYACYTDKTCLRNALVFALGQQLGRWSPRTRFVELYLDGVYQGLYMVWERIRRDQTRVQLPKPAASAALGDLTGGYIIRHEGEGKGSELVGATLVSRDFSTQSGLVYTYHYPNLQNLTSEQGQYIRDHFQAFESALAAAPGDYAQWIDAPSWVDRGIVEEVTNNWDGYVHSIYMTKDSEANGGLLGMGALWDFDLAFANGRVEGTGGVTGYNCKTDNWSYQNLRDPPDHVPAYWLALYANASFQTAWKCRYQALRQGPLSLATFDARIAEWTAFTEDARARDQAVWNTIGKSIFPNCDSKPTYAEEVQYLRDWIAARLAWLDAQASAMPGSCP